MGINLQLYLGLDFGHYLSWLAKMLLLVYTDPQIVSNYGSRLEPNLSITLQLHSFMFLNFVTLQIIPTKSTMYKELHKIGNLKKKKMAFTLVEGQC